METNVGQKAKGAAQEVAESQKEKALGGLTQVAQAIRQSGEHLRNQQQEQMAEYAQKAAEQVERFSNYIRSTNIRQLIGEIENVARREPALFLGGAFTAGLLAARFLKSSSRQSLWRGRDDGNYSAQREPFKSSPSRPRGISSGQTSRSSDSTRPSGSRVQVKDPLSDIQEH